MLVGGVGIGSVCRQLVLAVFLSGILIDVSVGSIADFDLSLLIIQLVISNYMLTYITTSVIDYNHGLIHAYALGRRSATEQPCGNLYCHSLM